MKRILDTKYWISRDGGQILNKESGRYIKTYVRGNGYVYATLLKTSLGGVWSYYKPVGVHRLVALAWLDVPEGWKGLDVDHLDGDKGNNDYENLEWVTHRDGCKRRSAVKPHVSGSDHWNWGRKVGKVSRRKMSEAKVGENHPRFKGWYQVDGVRYASAYIAGEALGVSNKTVQRRCADPYLKNWKFIPKG